MSRAGGDEADGRIPPGASSCDDAPVLARELIAAKELQAATSAVLSIISSSPAQIQPVLDMIVETACRLCEAYDAAIFLEDDGDLRVAAHRGPITIDFERWPINRAWVSGRAVVDRAPVHVHDLAAACEFPEGQAMSLRFGHRTILALPLTQQDTALGAIMIRRREVRPFSEDQIAALEIFVRQAVIAIHNARMFEELQARTRETLSRYFSPKLAERLASDSHAAELAGKRRDVAVMFTDIAGFTSLAESLDPSVLASLINDYFGEMTEIVFSHDGTVTKIMGDALHVLFGAPVEQQDYAQRAVDCAMALDAFSESFRARWRTQGIALGVTRIGVHAGPAIVGNFGSGRFFDYTAHGDTINIAARLEAANKQLGTRICVSARVAELLPAFVGRPIGDLLLRGKASLLRAFEPLTSEQHRAPTTSLYAEAFDKLQRLDPAAMPAFATLVGMRPDDELASFHLRRLLNGSSGTRIDLAR